LNYGGASINLIPRVMFKKLGKDESDIMQTRTIVTSFNGKKSSSNRVVILNRVSMFVAILSKSIFNVLHGRDRIHVVMLWRKYHQHYIKIWFFWNDMLVRYRLLK